MPETSSGNEQGKIYVVNEEGNIMSYARATAVIGEKGELIITRSMGPRTQETTVHAPGKWDRYCIQRKVGR